MDYSLDQVARQMTAGYTAAHPGFAVRPEHVAKVVTVRKPVYGSYDICSWPTNAQQRTILDLAFSDYRAAKANRFPIPCPEPSEGLSQGQSMKLDVDDPRTADHGWRRGLDAAARHGADRPWFGGTVWGRAYQAGLAYGRQFA